MSQINPLDLHVLGAPLAFILSYDQTLWNVSCLDHRSEIGLFLFFCLSRNYSLDCSKLSSGIWDVKVQLRWSSGRFIWKRVLKSKLFSTYFIKSQQTASRCGNFFCKIVRFLRRFACFLAYWLEDQFLWTSNSRKSPELSRILYHFFSICTPSYSLRYDPWLRIDTLQRKYRAHIFIALSI